MEGNHSKNGGNGVAAAEVAVAAADRRNVPDMVLRLVATALCLVAAVVLGVNKQTALVPVKLLPALPPLNVPATAKWHYMSAFVYFVVANAVACSYGAISMVVQIARKGGRSGVAAVITTMDVAMVALVSSSVGATTAVGVIGYQGNSHVRWNKVCDVFDKFCHQVAVAVVASLLASVSFLLLVLFAALRRPKIYY